MRLSRLSLGLGLPFGGGGGVRDIPIVGANYLNPVFTFSRASSATAFDATGTLLEFGNNVPRLTSEGLLMGGQRTNGVRNPRAAGAVAGTPGTMPTHWAAFSASGVTSSVVGTGVEGNLPYVDVRWNGTPAASGVVDLQAEAESAISGSLGQHVSTSMFISLVAGSTAGFSALQLQNSGFSVFPSATVTPTIAPLASQRWQVAAALDQNATSLRPRFRLGIVSGVPVDATFRFSLPQVEVGAAFASSPILPPIGTPGASTRLADNVTATGAQFAALFPNGVGTVLVRATLPVLSPTGSTNQVLLSIGPDTANRIVVFNPAGSTNLSVGRSVSGSFASAGTGAIASGVPFSFGLTSDGTTLAVSINGGVLLTAAGVPPFQRLVIGADANLGTPMFGTINSLRALPRAVSDAELSALSLAA